MADRIQDQLIALHDGGNKSSTLAAPGIVGVSVCLSWVLPFMEHWWFNMFDESKSMDLLGLASMYSTAWCQRMPYTIYHRHSYPPLYEGPEKLPLKIMNF